jgi:hypothetical protein
MKARLTRFMNRYKWEMGGFALGAGLSAAVVLAQQVTTLRPGQVRIIASYIDATGHQRADTVVVNVQPVPVATVQLFNQVNPAAWTGTAVVGRPFCVYVQAKDSAGNVLTGRAVQLTSTDTTVAKITSSGACADTTVDITKVIPVVLPPVPPLYRGH